MRRLSKFKCATKHPSWPSSSEDQESVNSSGSFWSWAGSSGSFHVRRLNCNIQKHKEEMERKRRGGEREGEQRDWKGEREMRGEEREKVCVENEGGETVDKKPFLSVYKLAY